MRPAEVELLIGDPNKAKQQFGWQPAIDFPGLVKLMLDADLVALDLPTSDGNKIAESDRDFRTLSKRFAAIVD